MLRAPIPEDEERRLCNVIYTEAEEAFDDVARLAADICGTEIALITLVDSDRDRFLQSFAAAMTRPPTPIRGSRVGNRAEHPAVSHC
jgi:hypothetical protein